MPTRKYKFVSPSVQTREVDLTFRPQTRDGIGALVIGRSERGPALTPVQVEDVPQFLQTFGAPIPGGGTLGNDTWRDGNYTAPTYGAYAAQAYLKSKGPLTFVRLLGDQHEDATTAGAAGWPQDGNFTSNAVVGNNAGAYGLFIINSGSDADYNLNTSMTGALGAIFYLKEGASIRLVGHTSYGRTTENDELSGAAQPIKSVDVNKTFKAVITEGSGSAFTASFNFQPDSDRFIRKVFNTNPILTNASIVDSTSVNFRKYWLGETYEDFVDRQVSSGSVSGSVFGVILPIASGSGNAHGGDFRFRAKGGKTGWVFSQDLSNDYASYHPINMTKLFRFHNLTPGDWEQKNLKISISNIKSSKNLSNEYGIFDVEIRKIDDNDQSQKVVERFVGCNLNPFSNDYIGKKIGTMNRTWDYIKREYVEYGDYINRSKFIYVEIADDVEQALTDPRLLPFGFYGTPRFKGITMSTTGLFQTDDLVAGNVLAGNVFARGTGSLPHAASGSDADTTALGVSSQGIAWSILGTDESLAGVSGSFLFPTHPMIVSASDVNTTTPFDAYFGIDVYRNGSARLLAENHKDIVRALPENYDESDASVEVSYYFSLDDLRQASSSGAPSTAPTNWFANAFYESGSRVLGQSITALGANSPLNALATSSYESVLNAGFDKFTMPIYGGFDGFDVAEKEPFRNTFLQDGTERTNYAYNSIQRALDSISDPEVVEYDLATIPGITNEGLTRKLIDICEERSDALAIIDLKGDYVPFTENTSTEAQRQGDVDTVISNLKNRGINSSYGCAFYPWVKVRDTLNDNILPVPASVVALGTMANTDRNFEPWFAPAGFNRGGLSKDVAGIPVVGIQQHVKRKDRDKLYEANINPIGKFPRTGIAILGQKTLQVTPSALDRINVRRLLLTTKKRISTIANELLFDQNVESTWERFVGEVEPYLRSVQARFGLSDFRVVLDEATTTDDLVDRNIMFAKILMKPARAIEYIAIDFEITNTGAAFED